jgi:hypothetical protein
LVSEDGIRVPFSYENSDFFVLSDNSTLEIDHQHWQNIIVLIKTFIIAFLPKKKIKNVAAL